MAELSPLNLDALLAEWFRLYGRVLGITPYSREDLQEAGFPTVEAIIGLRDMPRFLEVSKALAVVAEKHSADSTPLWHVIGNPHYNTETAWDGAWDFVKRLETILAVGKSAKVRKTELTDSGWSFSPGQVTRRGVTFNLKGVRLLLLKTLVESGKPLTEQELIEAGWGHDSDKEPKTLQNQLSKLRSILRAKLSFGSQDPIPVVDNGRNRAWKIADFLLP